LGWKDTVGGKLTVKIKAGAFETSVEAGLEASYEHSIPQTDTWSTGYKYTIPYNYRSALYLQHGMMTVSGSFSIISGGNRYLVKNGVFTLPIDRAVQAEGHGQNQARVRATRGRPVLAAGTTEGRSAAGQCADRFGDADRVGPAVVQTGWKDEDPA
jgi:hypothetical protein